MSTPNTFTGSLIAVMSEIVNETGVDPATYGNAVAEFCLYLAQSDIELGMLTPDHRAELAATYRAVASLYDPNQSN